ncbi:hypothetical protein ACFV3R_05710 [Streptomyces sp. NPDC059740]|uniref:hypothetical protein n=1 Tax=Streptomyces sp. NPDC059740 TaxID=3346926 RepID=UPI003651384C
MTETGGATGFRGREGIVSLVESCLTAPPAAERPFALLLGPRGSGASETYGVLMERFGPTHPFAYVRFAPGQALLPRYGLGLLARQLERKLPRYRRSHFPLLTLGLLASDQDLPMARLEDDRRSIRRHLESFQERTENRYGDYLAAFLDVAGGAIGVPDGASSVVSTLLGEVQRRSRRRGPGARLTTVADWYGRHPLIPHQDRWEALAELNRWRHQGGEDDKDRLDRVLFSAFMEDLRRNVAVSFSPRSYLLLLHDVHTEYGRRFLDLLLQARHDDTVVAGRTADPLTIVASSHRWLPRWGPATGEQWPWRLRLPDRASLADWRENRPSRDSDDTWWYPLRLRDLGLGEVRIHIEQQVRLLSERRARGEADPVQAAPQALAPFVRLSPFVHRLTRGLPRAVHQVLGALQHSGAPPEPGPDQERWLRTLPERTLRSGEGNTRLVDAALGELLDGFDARDRDRLTECAAAEDLYVGTQVLSHGEGLFTELRARWLLQAPGGLRPSLHPWLRRMLLWRLAQNPGDWGATHELLAEHYAQGGDRVRESYHRLAGNRIGEATAYLVRRAEQAGAEEWISEFDRITAAPNALREPGSPLELLASLTPSAPGEAMDLPKVVRGLVVARWLWSDPLTDPVLRLSHVIADGYIQLSRMWRSDTVALLNESERYHHWRPELGNEG